MRRPALVGVLAVLLSSPFAVGVSASAEPGAVALPAVDQAPSASRAVLRASQPDAMPGERIGFVAGPPTSKAFRRLRAGQRRQATLVLQRRIGDRWRSVASRRLRTNRVRYVFKTPSTARGRLQFRTVARFKGRTYRAGALRLRTVLPRVRVTPARPLAGAEVTFEAAFTPARAGRRVRLQVHRDGTWQDVGDASRADAEGTASIMAETPDLPVWYRLVAGPYRGAPGFGGDMVRTVLEREPTTVAHRAGAGAAPEQTLAAVRHALSTGVTAMEVDVQLTKDRVPVIMHDTTLARTTNVEDVFPDRAPWNLSDFTLAEVKQLDAGAWFDASFSGEKVPTMDEVIAAIGPATHLVLEVKSPQMPGNSNIEQILARELANGPLGGVVNTDRLTVSSFDTGWLKRFATAHPQVPVGALWFLRPSAGQLDDWQTWAEEAHLPHAQVDRELVDDVRARGMSTSLWTVNEVADLERALLMGVDDIITDFPDRVAALVAPPRPEG